jgi:Acetyltransferase (GNAT) domain
LTGTPANGAAGVPAGIAALDRLSERLLAATPALRVAVAATDAECEATYRLRHEQVVTSGWAPPHALGSEFERDGYDDTALHIGAWDGHALAGTLRVVLPAHNRRLPVEAAFDLDIEPRGAVAEAGRLVVATAYRGDPAHRIWGALFARAWLSMRAHGLAVLAGAASPAMIERLRARGLPFEILAPARPHWGEDRHPVRLDPAQSRPRWFPPD